MHARSVAQWGPALSHPVDCRLCWSVRQRLPGVGRTGWKGAGGLSQNDRSTLSALEWWPHGLFSCQTSSNWLQKICVEVTQRPQVHHKVILLSTNCETIRRWVKEELKIFPTRALWPSLTLTLTVPDLEPQESPGLVPLPGVQGKPQRCPPLPFQQDVCAQRPTLDLLCCRTRLRGAGFVFAKHNGFTQGQRCFCISRDPPPPPPAHLRMLRGLDPSQTLLEGLEPVTPILGQLRSSPDSGAETSPRDHSK